VRSGEKKNIRTGMFSWLAWRDAALGGVCAAESPEVTVVSAKVAESYVAEKLGT